MDLTGKTVTVIGAGKSGIAAVYLLLGQKAKVQVSDFARDCSLPEEVGNSVESEFGGHTKELIQKSDLVIVSPGVPKDSDVFQWAREKDIPVWGEIELAFRFCRRPIIAVTGSNGKTTVSTLISQVLQHSGKKVALCGNIGVPFSQEVLQLQNKDFVVLEVSSFQLETIVEFQPFIAILLNVTQNHLDRHLGFEDYRNIKARIFSNQKPTDVAILNYQDPSSEEIIQSITSRVFYFNKPSGSNGHVLNPNVSAVQEVCKVLGVNAVAIDETLESFHGVEHRMEHVRDIAGIHFVNDSKSTTADSAQWALQNTADSVLMICGGRDKNIDFSAIQDVVKDKVKRMYVIGEAKEKIKSSFSEVVEITECPDLKSAILQCKTDACAGDTVLLSPMCTSFDMYKNYEERGEDFKRIVNAL